MKKNTLVTMFALTVFSAISLTSCAVGSATAAYAVKAHEADGLSAQAEQRVVDRVKSEIIYELSSPASCPSPR